MNRLMVSVGIIALAFAFAGCAGSNKTPAAPVDVYAQMESEALQFVADSSPMPDTSEWLQAANNGDPAASFVLHMMYRDNIGNVAHINNGEPTDDTLDEKDRFREMLRWRDKTSNGDYYIYSKLARTPSLIFSEYEKDDDSVVSYGDADAKARAFLEEAAKRGYANAEYILGLIHWNGMGVAVDKNKAFALLVRAANHGVSNAQFDIGMMYELGLNGNANAEKARIWLEKAAGNNNPDALFILAMKYADGIGVSKNIDKTHDYENKDLTYHVWMKMHRDYVGQQDVLCSFDFDESRMKHINEDDCGGEDEFWFDTEDMTEEEIEKQIEARVLELKSQKSLPYTIDYLMARKWLERSAENVSNDQSRMLLAQIYTLSGCRGGKDVSSVDTVNLAASLIQTCVDHQTPYAKFAMGQLYHLNAQSWEYRDNEENLEKRDEWYRNALDWYEKAAQDDDKKACMVLADVYSGVDYPSISDILGIEADKKKAFEYGQKSGDPYIAARSAVDNAEQAAAEGKEEETIEWYLKAIDLYVQGDPENANREQVKDLYVKIGEIYDHSKTKLHSLSKAMEYYSMAVTGDGYKNMYPADLEKVATRLGEIYNKGKEGIKTNKKLSLEWYRRAVEATYYGVQTSAAFKHISEQPKADLKEAIEYQIKLEHDKKVNEFFVIKSGLKPCIKNNNACPAKVTTLYLESIQKAITAITAYSLATTGKADLTYIDNTFYFFAIALGHDDSYRNQLSKYSVAYDAIYNNYDLIMKDREMLFYIWFLRQIPYAAADAFQKMQSEKSWDDYMKEAQKLVKKESELKNGFGYDLLSRVQSFKAGLNP